MQHTSVAVTACKECNICLRAEIDKLRELQHSPRDGKQHVFLLMIKGCSVYVQGAFRQVAVEADACAKELTLILKQRMVTQKDQAAECIQMVRKLGEPIESLQVLWRPACLSVRLYIQLSSHQSVRPFVHPSVCLCVSLLVVWLPQK